VNLEGMLEAKSTPLKAKERYPCSQMQKHTVLSNKDQT